MKKEESLVGRMRHAACHCEGQFDAEWEAKQLRDGADEIERLLKMTSKEDMTPNEAVQKLAEIDCAVRVQKLGRVTLIGDCSEELWAFLGLTLEQVRCNEGKRPQVGDFPHDIWMCQIGLGYHKSRKRCAYGKSFAEAVNSAVSPNVK